MTVEERIAQQLVQISENVSKVYEAGKAAGGGDAQYEQGYNDGFAKGESAGAQSEYDRFWDAYQQNGNRTSYSNAFYRWDNESFKPKYPIIGIDMQGTFLYATIEEINVDIDARNTINMNSCFNRCTNLRKIKKIIAGENTVFHVAMFSYSTNIEELYFEGVIAMNLALNSLAKLTHDSLMSTINALKDYSGSGTTYTLTLGATNLAKLTDAEKAIATQKGWTLA